MPRSTLRAIAFGLVVLGIVLAVVGIIQRASGSDRIYGLWEPVFRSNPFGPFVNPNHFTGWMLMAVPTGLGYLRGLLNGAAGRIGSGWRKRVLWLSSSEASRTVLIGLSLLVMAVALELTDSKSGIVAFATAVAITAFVVARRQRAATRRWILLGYLGGLAAISAGWVGVDAMAAEFASIPGSNFGGRLPVWRDTLSAHRPFEYSGALAHRQQGARRPRPIVQTRSMTPTNNQAVTR